jgi:hypothetical protein
MLNEAKKQYNFVCCSVAIVEGTNHAVHGLD